MTDPDPPPHPADLPCVDPDCRGYLGFQPNGTITCQRCSARIERAKRANRLRYQRGLFDSPRPDHDDYHERTP